MISIKKLATKINRNCLFIFGILGYTGLYLSSFNFVTKAKSVLCEEACAFAALATGARQAQGTEKKLAVTLKQKTISSKKGKDL